jgi:hypothetical protein
VPDQAHATHLLLSSATRCKRATIAAGVKWRARSSSSAKPLAHACCAAVSGSSPRHSVTSTTESSVPNRLPAVSLHAFNMKAAETSEACWRAKGPLQAAPFQCSWPASQLLEAPACHRRALGDACWGQWSNTSLHAGKNAPCTHNANTVTQGVLLPMSVVHNRSWLCLCQGAITTGRFIPGADVCQQ